MKTAGSLLLRTLCVAVLVVSVTAWSEHELTSLWAIDGEIDDNFSGPVSKPVMSADMQHILACASTAGVNFQGKCYVMSETEPGMQDWQNNQVILSHTDSINLGQGPIHISFDGQHVCLGDWYNGQVFVFSETAAGERDWHSSVSILNFYDLDGSLPNFNKQGAAEVGAVMSADNMHVVSMQERWMGSQGKIYVFTASNPGLRDWNDTQTGITHAGGVSGEYLGGHTMDISADGQRIVGCTNVGSCILFTASAPGELDWELDQVVIAPVDRTTYDTMFRDQSYLYWRSDDYNMWFGCDFAANSYQGACMVFHTDGVGSTWEEQLLEASDGEGNEYLFGGMMSANGEHAMACSARALNNMGQCYIWSETEIGDRDWDANEMQLVPARLTGEDMYVGHAFLSPDGTYAMASTVAHSRIYVWTESYPGARDWNEHESFMAAVDGIVWSGIGRAHFMSHNGRYYIAGAEAADNNKGAVYVFENQCYNISCGVYGICVDEGDSARCECSAGYTGELCDVEINECETLQACQHGSECTDLIATYSCDCLDTGFQGDNCTIDIDDCLVDPCATTGMCSDDGLQPNMFQCTCDDGYTGTLCDEDIDDCAVEPCVMGNCTDAGLVINSYACACFSGFSGTDCDADIDDCDSNPCVNGGTCSDDGSSPNSFNCSCGFGYTGTICSEDEDDCASSPCHPAGAEKCSDLGREKFNCTCQNGYTGNLCTVAPPSCYSSPCQNGGICYTEAGSGDAFLCSCIGDFVGPFCDGQLVDPDNIIRINLVLGDDAEVDSSAADADIIAVVLAQLLLDYPGSVPGQFNITVRDIAGTTAVIVEITSTDTVNATDVSNVIQDNAESNGWTPTVVTGDEVVIQGDTLVVENSSDTLLINLVIIGAGVFAVLVIGIALYIRHHSKRKIFRNKDTGAEYSLPV